MERDVKSQKRYYSTEVIEIYKEYESNKCGLNTDEVNRNREKYGMNQLESEKKISPLIIFLSQFKDFLVIVLLGASIISFVSGNVESTIIILVVLILNAILGTVQHLKAEKSIESLKNLSSPKSKVLRNSVKIEIASPEIVPGDIVIVEAGDIVPADGRLIESHSLMVNESSLTGESQGIEKTAEILEEKELSLGDQTNMVFSGSLVYYGRGVLIVTSTGMKTELGKIATLMEATKQKVTPLQASLDNFGKKLTISIIILCIIVFFMNLYHKVGVLDSLMFAVALAVAAIPEALGSIVTIVLAIGTQKLSKENAIVKNLKSVESLGCVGIICSDKTGTLTQNKMTVETIYADDKMTAVDEIDKNDKTTNFLLLNSLLCNDATLEVGDPTEIAFVSLGNKCGVFQTDVKEKYPRLREIPFDSERKLMSTLHNIKNNYIMFTKGAVDALSPFINNIYIDGVERSITTEDLREIAKATEEFANKGLRVLAFAYKKLDNERDIDVSDENNFTFIGLAALIDPPRPESKEAVEKCIKAGIKPIMITGDHKTTARTIASEIGIYKYGDKVMNGVDIENLSDEELKEIVPSTTVYARVSPEHKIRIVGAWQELGKICAMTGDGVNDAPALKKADIGIAMGITGTEVSKDAASMILSDDNFSTIVKAVTTGRNIYSNIKNSIRFLLSGNMAGIIAVLYSSLVGLPVIFAPVHLLFINLLTDSLPAIAIGMEPAHDDVLKDPPRDPKEPILTNEMSFKILFEGLLIAVAVLVGYYLGYENGNALKASTMAFSVLCLGRLFHGFNCRGRKNLFSLGIMSNVYSLIAFFLGACLLFMILLIPVFHKVFQVSALNSSELLHIIGLAFVPTLVIQLIKVIRKE
ncbi:cation-translocating P-type ATPase [Fusobacterium sp. PH5-44]|uniref:cation-translocating P-type ATPase n=1 Tax=unclassified Fusobacterium TaxID=2648384 RepID=UPI003D1A9F2D